MKKSGGKKMRYCLPGLLAGLLLISFVLDRYAFPLPRAALSRPHAQFVYSREGYLLNCFTSSDRFWRKPVTINQISPLLVQCVLGCEDRWFYYHPGFNPVSFFQAAVENIKAGRIVRGGSTITMQIARMMEPKERTMANKLVEVLRAVQLEAHFSKNELLEIYFNLVPYGGNIEGVGAASLFYFDKEAAELTLSECAVLAAIPVSPSKNRPDRDPAGCRRRRDRVLKNLLERREISRDEYDAAVREEIPSRRLSARVVAPHFCQALALEHPDSTVLASTIDFEIQSTCERLAGQHHDRLVAKDIHNLSVVVLDNTGGGIRAMVGSPDFLDEKHQGQINGARAARSPGSALKPFVYALGFDLGVISPQTRLADIPVDYRGYTPENYDDEYHGVVSTREALIQSYNVPAVNVTARVGLQEFYELLRSGGLRTLHRAYYDYGLPLVLGACEVSLVELSNLYATLARGGMYQDVTWLGRSENNARRRLFSAAAGYMISDILSELKRPDLPTSWEFTDDLPRIAWKTGTSYGRRDAWTIGYNPQYTVGVWAGNFSGAGSIDIVGAEIAAPLMFDILNELCSGGKRQWFDPPAGLEVRRVCAVSGKLPGDFCPETICDQHIPGISSTESCEIHRKIFVDRQTGHRLCRHCCAGRDYEEALVIAWPAKLAAWLQGAGRLDQIPAHDPDCRGMLPAETPVITSPENEAVYALMPGVPETFQRILFEVSLPAGSGRAHWFVDHQWLASCGAGERIFYVPTTGKHHLMCLDDQGRSQSIRFEVQ